jgi:hypothetical protein
MAQRALKMGESDAVLAGIDRGFIEQIAKIFGVFCSASDTDITSGAALERYTAGMFRALDRRAEARNLV